MSYWFFVSAFFISLLFGVLFFVGLFFRPKAWKKNIKLIQFFGVLWFVPYVSFIMFFTGPTASDIFPPSETSPYKLPWAADVTYFVAQGNRSFTTHRELHRYAFDFVMPNGTVILASRKGRVVEIVDQHDGIGLKSNFIHIEHEDGSLSGYAHIRNGSTLVKLGENVLQGQPLALSGMVGQSIMPHLHFYVLNNEKTKSLPISFREVPGGVVYAGHFYKSKNSKPLRQSIK